MRIIINEETTNRINQKNLNPLENGQILVIPQPLIESESENTWKRSMKA
jgi:hypothetical protein